MNAETFVEAIRKTVIEGGVTSYQAIFRDPRPTSDEFWIAARSLFESLSTANQETLLRIMRQVSVDTVSYLFGVLDGSSSVGGNFEDFDLMHRKSSAKISGDLQDLFLEAEEDSSDLEC